MAKERPVRVLPRPTTAALMALALVWITGAGPTLGPRPLPAWAQTAPDAEQEAPPPPPDPERDIDPERATSPADAVELQADVARPINFPVAGPVSYRDDFGACRDGCSRRHMGVDIFAPKLALLRAAADGHVTLLRTDASGTAGNAVGITDREGWRYLYLHINNDTPGTDDGRNPAAWRFVRGVSMGAKVYSGQVIGYVGDSGNAETTPPHLHFELRRPDLVTINPYLSLRSAFWANPVPRLYRFDSLHQGDADDHVGWGSRSANKVMACDVDGDGDDEPVYRSDSTFRVMASPTDLRLIAIFGYGRATDRPYCGDWNGDGRETPGVRRDKLFLLRNSLSGGPAHVAFAYGRSSDLPVVGDWDGDGDHTVGVVRSGNWLLSNGLTGGVATTTFRFGTSSDRPLPGDWDGDGDDTPGVQRGRTQLLTNRSSGGYATHTSTIGIAGDAPLVASWWTADLRGRDSISLWRRWPT